MKVSLGITPSAQARDIAQAAEAIGYDRVWLYDSPALYEDLWIHLAQIGEATQRVGLGTAVIVPSTRHVMTLASSIATVERIAPGRLACAIGTGYTARLVMGKKALGWKFVREYVEQLRALLEGRVVEIEGEPCQMIHHSELAQARPIRVPLLLSAFGPKGLAITRDIADGWMGVGPPPEPFDWATQLVFGTVLEDGESPMSPRVIDAAGPWQAGMYHSTWESDPAALQHLPGGNEWLAEIESQRSDERERHLAVHYGHVTHLNQADRKALHAAGDSIEWFGWVGQADELRARAQASADAGVSEILYTPSGSDVLGQLEPFYNALQGVS